MGKSATLNLRVNPEVRQCAEAVLSRLGISMSTAIDMYLNRIFLTRDIPLAVILLKAPTAINADLMNVEEVHIKPKEDYDEVKTGKVQETAVAFTKFR